MPANDFLELLARLTRAHDSMGRPKDKLVEAELRAIASVKNAPR